MINSYTNNIARNKMQTIINLQTTCDSKTLALIRADLESELEAITQYDMHANEISNDLAKTILREIRDEERVHAGELLALIDILCPEEATLRNKGREEVLNVMGQSKNT